MNLATRKLTRIFIAAVLGFSAVARLSAQDAKLQLATWTSLATRPNASPT